MIWDSIRGIELLHTLGNCKIMFAFLMDMLLCHYLAYGRFIYGETIYGERERERKRDRDRERRERENVW